MMNNIRVDVFPLTLAIDNAQKSIPRVFFASLRDKLVKDGIAAVLQWLN